MKVELLLAILSVPVVGGIVATRIRFKQKERGTIAASLARWAPQNNLTNTPLTLLRKQEKSARQFLLDLPGLEATNSLLMQSGMSLSLSTFLAVVLSLLTVPLFVTLALGIDS